MMNLSRKNGVSRGTRIPALPAGALLSAVICAAPLAADFQFDPPEGIPLPADCAATCLELRDRDGDGDLDAILASRSPDHVVLLMEGGPGGTLSPSGSLESPGQTDWIRTGDLDHDGAIDLVTAVRSTAGRIAIYDGDGSGGFAALPRVVPVGREVRHVALPDLDGDGSLDILALAHRTEDFHGLLGDGTGAFSRSDRRRLAPWVNGNVYPQSFINADLDGDDREDAIFVSIGSRSVHVAKGAGDGTFGSPRSWVAPKVDGEAGGCAYVAAADFDSDGLLELVAPQTTWGQQWFILFELDESGAIVSGIPMSGSPFGISWTCETGDFDGDGDPDLCIAHALPGVVTFMENLTAPGQSTTFGEPQWFFSGEFIRHLVVADIDFDGDEDVLALDYTGDQILLFRNALHSGSTNRHGCPGRCIRTRAGAGSDLPPGVGGALRHGTHPPPGGADPHRGPCALRSPDPSGEGAAE